MTKLLVIDSYDSFIYTFVDYLHLLDASTTVVRNDVVDLASTFPYGGMLTLPGPRTSAKAEATAAAIEQCAQTKTPMLGMYLGHQALVEIFGGVVSHAPILVHGKTSVAHHNGGGPFEGPPSPLAVGRYYSLATEPDTVREPVITTRTDDGVVMGVEDAGLPLWDVQFHPESVLTRGGRRMLVDWLAICGQPKTLETACGKAPLIRFDERAS